MKISVIIPAFNEELFLGNCLKALTDQSEKPYEIIVVDNNSTDKTRLVAKKFGVKLVKENKPGITAARNRGFNTAKGDIIARTDADTIVGRNWIKRIHQDFENHPDLLGLSGSARVEGIPKSIQYRNWTGTGFNQALHFAVMKQDVMFGFNLALTKKAWNLVKDEVCQNDKEVHEDVDLAIHLAAHGKVFYDEQLVVSTSPRRARNFESYFEYPYRYIKTINKHKKLFGIELSKTDLIKTRRMIEKQLDKLKTLPL